MEFITFGSEIQVDDNVILRAISKRIDEDDVLCFEIEDKSRSERYDVFRNCRNINEINSCAGCGRVPFRVDFIGDIINDKSPEIALSADKEGSVLKFVIGFKDNKFKVLKWTEFD